MATDWTPKERKMLIAARKRFFRKLCKDFNARLEDDLRDCFPDRQLPTSGTHLVKFPGDGVPVWIDFNKHDQDGGYSDG